MIFKCGKLKPTQDDRTLKLSSILTAPVKVPATYSFDAAHPGCRPHMFLNDTYGDCVMACRAESQMRLDLLRTGTPSTISDSEVRKEYFKESGGQDSGLNMLDSLKEWRTSGWVAGGKRKKIHAFASVNFKSKSEVKQAIYLNNGMPIGVALPDDAMDEFTHGKPWSNTKLPPDQNEGHCIYLTGYTATGPTCITWGGYQALTWAWLTKYCDEAYFVLDDPANPKYNEVLDHDVLHAHLEGCRSANSFWRHNRFLWK